MGAGELKPGASPARYDETSTLDIPGLAWARTVGTRPTRRHRGLIQVRAIWPSQHVTLTHQSSPCQTTSPTPHRQQRFLLPPLSSRTPSPLPNWTRPLPKSTPRAKQPNLPRRLRLRLHQRNQRRRTSSSMRLTLRLLMRLLPTLLLLLLLSPQRLRNRRPRCRARTESTPRTRARVRSSSARPLLRSRRRGNRRRSSSTMCMLPRGAPLR